MTEVLNREACTSLTPEMLTEDEREFVERILTKGLGAIDICGVLFNVNPDREFGRIWGRARVYGDYLFISPDSKKYVLVYVVCRDFEENIEKEDIVCFRIDNISKRV